MLGKKKLKLVFVIATGLVLLALILPGCRAAAPEEKPVVTVKYAYLSDFTGPCAPSCVPVCHATTAWFKGFNEEGGFDGKAIVKDTFYDTEYKADKSMLGYTLFKGDPSVLAFYVGAAMEHSVVQPLVTEDRFPGITGYLPYYSMFPPGWIFGAAIWSPGADAALLKWVTEGNNAAKMGLEKPIKVAIFAPTIPGLLQECEYMRYVCGELDGIDCVGLYEVPYAPSDCTSELLRAKEAGANLLHVHCCPSAIARVARDAYKLGIYPDAKISMMHNHASRAFETLVADIPGGIFTVGACPLYEDKPNPDVKKAAALLGKYFGVTPEDSRCTMTTFGAGQAATFIEGCRRAAKEVGWENMHGQTGRDALYKALVSFKNVPIMGMKETFGDSRCGIREINIIQIKEGHWHQVSDYFPYDVTLPEYYQK